MTGTARLEEACRTSYSSGTVPSVGSSQRLSLLPGSRVVPRGLKIQRLVKDSAVGIWEVSAEQATSSVTRAVARVLCGRIEQSMLVTLDVILGWKMLQDCPELAIAEGRGRNKVTLM